MTSAPSRSPGRSPSRSPGTSTLTRARDAARAPVAVRLRYRSVIAATLATVIGFASFLWPFWIAPGQIGSTYTPPIMFGLLLVLVLGVVFAEIADGGIDSKAVAMLGVLSAVNAGLRPLGAGTAGIETVFFVLILAGRVFGPGFGFSLGCTSLFASAIITGGVGPWMPYQMFGCAWIGLGAGLLPRCRGKLELALLAAYGVFAGYFFGFMLNLQFWPFSVDPASSIAYQPGASFTEQWHRYLLFDGATSLGWDTGRAITDLVAILVVGPACLATFRRAARRAAFEAPVEFPDAVSADGSASDVSTPNDSASDDQPETRLLVPKARRARAVPGLSRRR